MNFLSVMHFAQVSQGYGCQAYGVTDAYNSCAVTNSGGLANTGNPVALVVSVALMAITAAVIIHFWPARKKSKV
ncbi:MAG: hypothetical protein V4702_01180 [Patescibacteria group bacterium]